MNPRCYCKQKKERVDSWDDPTMSMKIKGLFFIATICMKRNRLSPNRGSKQELWLRMGSLWDYHHRHLQPSGGGLCGPNSAWTDNRYPWRDSGNVHEDKGADDNLPDVNDDISTQLHVILRRNARILQNPSALLPLLECWGINRSLENAETPGRGQTEQFRVASAHSRNQINCLL